MLMTIYIRVIALAYDPLGACLGTAENKPGLTQVTLNKNDQEAIRTQLNFLNDRDSFLLQ